MLLKTTWIEQVRKRSFDPWQFEQHRANILLISRLIKIHVRVINNQQPFREIKFALCVGLGGRYAPTSARPRVRNAQQIWRVPYGCYQEKLRKARLQRVHNFWTPGMFCRFPRCHCGTMHFGTFALVL